MWTTSHDRTTKNDTESIAREIFAHERCKREEVGGIILALLTKQIIGKIERELYDYPTNLKEANNKRDDIINGSHYPEVSVSGGEMSNTTQSKGMRLAEIETEWTDIITEALQRMPGDYERLANGIYWQHKQVFRVAEELHISQALGYVWREQLILYIALLATQKNVLRPFN